MIDSKRRPYPYEGRRDDIVVRSFDIIASVASFQFNSIFLQEYARCQSRDEDSSCTRMRRFALPNGNSADRMTPIVNEQDANVKETVIDPEQFTFNRFIRFYMLLMERNEVDKLFDAT
jgi:hypothetical protein